MKTYQAIRCVTDTNGFLKEWDYGFIKAENHTSALIWLINKFGEDQLSGYWSVKAVA